MLSVNENSRVYVSCFSSSPFVDFQNTIFFYFFSVRIPWILFLGHQQNVFFNWKVNNCFMILCWFHQHQHGSAIGINVYPPSWNTLPFSTPSSPSRLSQNTGLSSLHHTTNSHWLSILNKIMYLFPCYIAFLSASFQRWSRCREDNSL